MIQVLLITVAALSSNNSHPNLVVNGNFEKGNTGFTSDYGYSDNVEGTGLYAIVSDPHNAHQGGFSMMDHTSGTGQMMVVNAGGDASKAFWKQTVKVQPNHSYYFGLYAASWGQTNETGDENPASIVVTINGEAVRVPFTLKSKDGVWTKLVATWKSNSATRADIRLVDKNTEAFGNDFAIDDIMFHD